MCWLMRRRDCDNPTTRDDVSQYCPTFRAVGQFSHPAVIEAGQDVRLSTGQTSDHRRIAMSLGHRVCRDRDIRTTEDWQQ